MTQERILDLAAKAGRPGLTRVTETVGREVASAQGAKVLLMPAIRKLGPTYSLEMRAVDPATDGSRFTLADRATSKEALLDLLDRISERTRTELGEGRDDIARAHVELGTSVTRSLEAYQRYVEGRELWLRDGQPAFALSRLEEALRLDPRFAPAHAHLAGLLEDYGRPDLAAPHWRAAQEQNEQLPEKERRMLQLGLGLRTQGAAPRSEEAARRIAEEAVARFPSDKDVLLEAADVFMSLGLADRRDAALRAAVDLDPGHWATAWKLSRRLGAKTEEALSVARHAVAARRSAANVALLAEALHAAGATSEAAAAAREALAAPRGRTSLVAERACFVLHQTGADGECRTVWEQMKSGGANALERDAAASEIVVSLLVRGRSREGLRALRATEEHRRGEPGRNAYAITIGHDRRSAPPDALAEVRRIPGGLLQRNFLAWLGRAEEAERADAELGERWTWGHQAQWIYEAIRAADQGHFGEAARLMRSAYDAVLAANASTYPWSRAAFLVEALVADGRPEEALAVAPPSLPCRCRDPVDYGASYPPFAIARARAMEGLGRPADAVRELDGVLAFWSDADPDLPLLVEAKAMRKRLAKSPAPAKGAAAPATPPSIAVLPFADMSPGKDQEYFADGVAEEILGSLSRVPGLRVPGRTSSFWFKGMKVEPAEIARKLRVAHLLQGSVRRSGDRLRITAEVVKASDGDRVWSETYERQLVDVFTIQDEIARSVVRELAPMLLARTLPPPPAATTDLEAYRLFLLGRSLFARGAPGSTRDILETLERSAALDPRFAPTQAYLAVARGGLARSTRGEESRQLRKAGGEAAARALALDPTSPWGYIARAWIRLNLDLDWTGASGDLDRAEAIDPANESVLNLRALLLLAFGRTAESVEVARRAVELSPLNAAHMSNLALGLVCDGHISEGREWARRTLEISPGQVRAVETLAYVALLTGQAEHALAEFERAPEPLRSAGIAAALHSLGRERESWDALARLERERADEPVFIAGAHAWRGDPDGAFRALDRAVHERSPHLARLHAFPLLGPLHSDPRWKALLRKMNLPVE
ncbi:MAG: hypothetical protein HZB56_00015 [Deltaproteobacteria bacterium]|nr:hypothetical protein [Deltaproteobacteria bacterium]